MSELLRIATRKSPLAIWQAEHVAQRLEATHPGLKTELVGMTTRGDQVLDSPLAKIGGKGLFVKELEAGMLEGRADIAVHSMKDVPMHFPEGLSLAVILDREDPSDAFVSNDFGSLEEMPEDAVVGTSSLRRALQLRARFPKFQIKDLRGNVNTRLKKLDAGEYQAIILASAGLKRLGFDARIKQQIAADFILPAIGQGAIGIECRTDDQATLALLQPLHHEATAIRLAAERAFNQRLNGGCQVPIAGFAELKADQLSMRALIGMPDGSEIFTTQGVAKASEAERLGVELAEALLSQGAGNVLKACGLTEGNTE